MILQRSPCSQCAADDGWALNANSQQMCSLPVQQSILRAPPHEQWRFALPQPIPFPCASLTHCKWCSNSPSSSRSLLSSLSLVCLPSLPLPHYVLPRRRHAFLNHSILDRGVSSVSAGGYTEYYTIIAFLRLPLFIVFSLPSVHAQHVCGRNAAMKSKMAVWTSGQCWMRGEASAAVPWDTSACSKPSLLIDLLILFSYWFWLLHFPTRHSFPDCFIWLN